jgi:dihydroorotate dehydrogenase (NAD+) catalytic subunit
MIELAPGSKTGLALRSRFILGSGAVGWGEAWPPGVEPAWFGAFVTPPLTMQARRGTAGPRLAEISGGFILNTGDHNPGLRRVFRDDVERWDSLDLPVIVALAGAGMDDWLRLGGRLEEIMVAGLEAQLPSGVTPREAAASVANLKRGCQLPVLVKLGAIQAAQLAEAVAGAGADALVVATPPHAAGPPRGAGLPHGAGSPHGAALAVGGELVEGPIGGPAAFPFTLRALRCVAELELGLPIVAAGGITTEEDVAWCWRLGADAVQLRSLLWTSPASVVDLIQVYHKGAKTQG